MLIEAIKFHFFRISVLIIGMILFSCASGLVTTEINTSKNPPIGAPREFQSPYHAIDKLAAAHKKTSPKDYLSQKFGKAALKTLMQQQLDIENELKLTGRLRLLPGLSYEFDLETFCVHAGVERPVKGDGLFLGEMQGKPRSWLPELLQNYKRVGISQEEAQVLVWSLLGETRYDQLSFKNQTLLLKLFPDAPVRFGNSLAEDYATNLLMSQLPTELLEVKNQFDKYHSLLQDSQKKFSEIERTLSPISSRANPIEVGWLMHEDGYFIHLKADGYQRTRVRIYMPESARSGTYFNPTHQIALPGQGQRLALSSNVINPYKNTANQFIKNQVGISAKEALFILKYPLDAYSIHQAAQKANQLTWSNFSSLNNFEDDKSDAFRHFVWSGLVTHEIGETKAKEFLDAHEDYPENKPSAKAMDLHNNNQGAQFAHNYNGSSFERDLMQAGLDKIENGDLKWIR